MLESVLKRWIANLLLVLFGLTVAVAALEGGARLLSGWLGTAPYMKYDATLGWVALPDIVKRHREERYGFDVTYTLNSFGMRGPNRDVAKPAGIVRIMLLGDSNGFGWGLDENSHLMAHLGRLAGVETFNLSLAGYGTDQELLRFRRDGLQFKPDVVIVQSTANDFEEIQHPFFNQKPKPHFVLTQSGELQLQNVPVRSEGPKAAEFLRNSLPLPYADWLGWNSFAYNLLNGPYFSMMRKFRSTRGSAQPAEIFTPGSIALYNRLLEEIALEVDRLGATGLLVHAVPELSQRPEWLRTRLPVVNLDPKFKASRAAGHEPLFEDGYHWNAVGHKIAADEVTALLRSLKEIK